MQRPRAGAAEVAAFGVTLVWIFILAGLFFHHSATPSILGRFSLPYAGALLVLIVLTPAVFAGARALFTPSVLRRKDGTELRVGVPMKVAVVLSAAAVPFLLAQVLLPPPRRLGMVPHPYLQAVPAPDAAAGVNSRGFRGREPAVPRPPGLVRVVLLGGSTTFGQGLSYEESYGRSLERALGARLAPRAVEVQAAAAPGFNTEHLLIRYAADAIDLDADLVLTMEAANDLFPYLAGRGFRPDYGHIPGIPAHPSGSWYDRSRLVGGISFLVKSVLYSDLKTPPLDVQNVVPDPAPFVRNLRSIVVLARSRGQRIVLCTQPHRYRLDLPAEDRDRGEAALRNLLNGMPLPRFSWFCRNFAAFNEATRRLAADEGVPLLDLEREIPPRPELFLDQLHVSPAGARLEAETAVRFLIDQRLVR